MACENTQYTVYDMSSFVASFKLHHSILVFIPEATQETGTSCDPGW